jgi:3'-phosphoadenosine 5'-phosphosulfate sulfotransferase (PAPS reductase)/FAD synthetase
MSAPMTPPHPPGAAIEHVVNISGGKDSAACYLLALLRGRPFRALMACVGRNEHEITREYAERLHERTGGPKVELIQADFTSRILARRAYVETAWRAEGVPESTIERVKSVLVPTGDPFVDLTLWKGRFPSRRAQFCTEFLKREPIDAYLANLLAVGPVVQWLGVRRDESLNRRHAPFVQRVRYDDGRHAMTMLRPLIHWTAQNVFSFAKACGLPPNPLYLRGAKRVGCFPCINSGKDDLLSVADVDPGALERLLEWEALVKAASKQGAATFFAPDVTPDGAKMVRRIKAETARRVRILRHSGLSDKELKQAAGRLSAEASAAMPWPNAADVFEWARTDRGGRQVSLDTWLSAQTKADEGVSCSSHYGLCE